MAKGRAQRGAAVGAVENGNSAVLVTVAPGGELLDRRTIDLTTGSPTHPHHQEGSWAVGPKHPKLGLIARDTRCS